jgi:hypothetical protein
MIDLLATSSSYSPLVFILPYSLTLTTVTCIREHLSLALSNYTHKNQAYH